MTHLRPLAFSCALAAVLSAPSALAATFTVNTVFDGADTLPGNGVCETLPGNNICTLRAAIQEANALAGADTISVPAGNFVLDRLGADEDYGVTGDLDITEELTIRGAGLAVTVIDANKIDRVFHLLSADATLSDLTIQNGKLAGGYGAGIFNNGGTLKLTDVLIRNNTSDGNSDGAGIDSGGTLEMKRVTLSANQAQRGGGLSMYGSALISDSTISGNSASLHGGGLFVRGDVILVNSTISGNSAARHGGGIFVFDDSGQTHHVAMYNVTLASNTADSDSDGEGDGGGFFIGKFDGSGDGEGFFARNSVISNNSDLSPGGGAFGLSKPHNCYGAAVSGGYNFVSNGYGCSGFANGSNGDQVGAASLLGTKNSKLDALAANGGATKTHLPQTGSPLVDAGNPAGCTDQNAAVLAADQRGYSRPAGARCDIGAVELDGAPPTPAPSATATPSPGPTPAPQCVAPAKPLLVSPGPKVKVVTRKVPLDWSDDDCATTYQVLVKFAAKKGKTVFKKTISAPLSQIITKRLAKGRAYNWQVSGCDASQCVSSDIRRFSVKR